MDFLKFHENATPDVAGGPGNGDRRYLYTSSTIVYQYVSSRSFALRLLQPLDNILNALSERPHWLEIGFVKPIKIDVIRRPGVFFFEVGYVQVAIDVVLYDRLNLGNAVVFII